MEGLNKLWFEKFRENLPKLFEIDTIGKLFLDRILEIEKDFFNQYLQKSTILAPFSHFMKPINTEVICPFCKRGVLQLTEKKKNICDAHVCHYGNSYKFRCSERCNKIQFTYSNRWLYC